MRTFEIVSRCLSNMIPFAQRNQASKSGVVDVDSGYLERGNVGE